ncbi:hypothetical protein C8R44DRAFT_749979 [Mycena epipterygia]|nr:hypothetical protein C8R44DRAFT_749979 [Mycena epipterygia]
MKTLAVGSIVMRFVSKRFLRASPLRHTGGGGMKKRAVRRLLQVAVTLALRDTVTQDRGYGIPVAGGAVATLAQATLIKRALNGRLPWEFRDPSPRMLFGSIPIEVARPVQQWAKSILVQIVTTIQLQHLLPSPLTIAKIVSSSVASARSILLEGPAMSANVDLTIPAIFWILTNGTECIRTNCQFWTLFHSTLDGIGIRWRNFIPMFRKSFGTLCRAYFNVIKCQYIQRLAEITDIQYVYNIADLWTLAGYSPRALCLTHDRLAELGVTDATHSLVLTFHNDLPRVYF